MSQKIGPLAPRGTFQPSDVYLDTPTYGLAPTASFDAMAEGIDRWRAGVATMAEYDEAVVRSRAAFSEITSVASSAVAIGANVSSLMGPVAAAIPDGAKVLIPEGEFTSLLFPLLVGDRLNVTTLHLDELSAAIDESTDVVAFSLVQSSTGRVADIEAIVDAVHVHDVTTLVDATHAIGWYPFDATMFDFVLAAAYKWLLCPRGVAFMIVHSDLDVQPLNAGWYAGDDPWSSIYGEPLRLAETARRFDTSPAWLSWVGAVPSLELIAELGTERINRHNVDLANRVREGLGMNDDPSAIVTFTLDDAASLAAAGVKASVRGGAVRIGCHIHNSSDDVTALLDVVG